MKIYMNNAATSYPKPECVALAAAQSLSELPGAANRGGIEDVSVFDLCRERLSRLLGVGERERILLLPNATAGLNLALFGFPFRAGDTVLTSLAEHNSVLRPLFELERRGLIKTVFAPTDRTGRVDPQRWSALVNETRPRLAVLTHASNVTGAVNDVSTLFAVAKAGGAATLLDASQTLGFCEARPALLGADMLAFTGHKYLLGPQGSGGLYVSPEIELSPTLFGGTGVRSDLDTMPDEYPQHLEAGTGNETSFAGLAAALEWAEQNPLDRAAVLRRLDALCEGILRAGGSPIVPNGERTPVVSFTADGMSCADVGYALESGCDIICRTGLHCAPRIFTCLERESGTVRLSISRFTTDDEISEVSSSLADVIFGGC